MSAAKKTQASEAKRGPRFTANKKDKALIIEIAQRATYAARGKGLLDVAMDIEACHCSGCPLDLEALLRADEFNFVHDVAGIGRHLDRSTGALRDCFVPRFSNAEGR